MRFFTRKNSEIQDYSKLTIKELVSIIKNDWINYNDNSYVVELLEAMSILNSIEDKYYLDDGIRIVVSFIDHSKKWNTFIAKNVKMEINRRIKKYNDKI